MTPARVCLAVLLGIVSPSLLCVAQSVGIVLFEVDASPPIGTPLAYDPTRGIQVPLSCKGIVLIGQEAPIVLCAVDWLGISNKTHREFREQLAKAARTTADRVALHTLHQHDAPRCDGSAAEILEPMGRSGEFYDPQLWQRVAFDAAQAIEVGMQAPVPVTHFAVAHAEVRDVASNRRLLDEKGMVFATRFTACRDPELQALPVGVIDPQLRMLAFYQDDRPLVALSFYATHPQSYYRTGMANPDFPGLAREQREQASGVMHVHFNGAGGNIGAGKFNDGSEPLRQVLADRMADGMKQAWDSLVLQPLTSQDVHWRSLSVRLPLADHLQEKELQERIASPATAPLQVSLAAEQLAFLVRSKSGDPVPMGCLKLPGVAVLSLPGELFVEYQLAASHLRPDLQVLTAAYGDYGPFYIGTRVAYGQGGYETSPGASNVSPEVESVLLEGLRDLLESNDTSIKPSDFTQTIAMPQNVMPEEGK